MSNEEVVKTNPLSYQNELTYGCRQVQHPGLISVPSLDTTLKMHREFIGRIERDIDWDWDGNITHDYTSVVWGDHFAEMSSALLQASAIASEIETGLELLEIDWRPALQGMFLPQTSEELPGLISCPPQYAVPEVQFDPIIRQAVEIVCFFSQLGTGWVVQETHAHGERCVDEEEGIYVTTVDEWYLDCPEFPDISGLRDWNAVPDDLEEEGYLFEGSVIIEDCEKVLLEIVDRILESERGS